MDKIRTGLGYDLHRIKEGGDLIVGGVKISEEMSFIAHSDGDLLLHAISDSLLGAAGEPDIGELFPDTDPAFKGADSRDLLKKVAETVNNKGYAIVNIDAVLVAEKPKISRHKEAIRKSVADILSIPFEDFNLKAKTKEKTGAVGRGEAMECHCVSLIRSI